VIEVFHLGDLDTELAACVEAGCAQPPELSANG
jgi:hypothetical protein